MMKPWLGCFDLDSQDMSTFGTTRTDNASSFYVVIVPKTFPIPDHNTDSIPTVHAYSSSNNLDCNEFSRNEQLFQAITN
jgi:hypothetical protein